MRVSILWAASLDTRKALYIFKACRYTACVKVLGIEYLRYIESLKCEYEYSGSRQRCFLFVSIITSGQLTTADRPVGRGCRVGYFVILTQHIRQCVGHMAGLIAA